MTIVELLDLIELEAPDPQGYIYFQINDDVCRQVSSVKIDSEGNLIIQ